MSEQCGIINAEESDILKMHPSMFIDPNGSHLTDRTKLLGDWVRRRSELGAWPYARALDGSPSTVAKFKNEDDRVIEGLNFGSQDYLGLSAHPRIGEAAVKALYEHGPHAAASPMLQGNTALSRKLEREVAELINTDHVLLYPTGWAAGFGAISGLVKQADHIVIDQLAHSCLLQGARAATRKIRFFRHNDTADVRRKLRRIRATDSSNAILVVTEALFSVDSDSPDICALQDACNEFGAVLLLDVAHDLGSQGPGGSGQLGVQKMLGKVDLLVGSFSKTFSSNGGFAAAHDRAVKQHLGIYSGSHTYSSAISPIQCGIVVEAIRIARSAEGDHLRGLAKSNITRLRDGLAAQGIKALGEPSNIVPVNVGDEKLARQTSRYLESSGLIANLIEHPAVAKGRARFRLQVMATHTAEQIESAVEKFSNSLEEARRQIFITCRDK